MPFAIDSQSMTNYKKSLVYSLNMLNIADPICLSLVVSVMSLLNESKELTRLVKFFGCFEK